MPSFNQSAPKRAANSTSGVRKPGSKAAGHRGYRPAESDAPKKRWTNVDRAQRANGAASGDRTASTDRRPDWTPREKPAYQPRGERPAYGDRTNRTERPAYNDRPARTERPSYGDRPARTDRPSYGDRAARTERPAYNDRPARTERPSYGDRPARTERPAYGDRPREDLGNQEQRAPGSH